MDYSACIKKLYPNILDNEFKLQDDSDGRGVYIKQWTYAQPQPTQAQFDAVYSQVLKEQKIKEFKRKAGEEILTKYPISKQINIDALQGYTQTDKDAMWVFINEKRDKSNTLEAEVNDVNKSVVEIEMVVW